MDKNKYNHSLLVEAPFESDRVNGGFPIPSLYTYSVTSSKIERLIKDLQNVLKYFEDKKLINGVLVTAFYTDIAPKSRRIQRMLSNLNDAYKYTVGARYVKSIDESGKTCLKHAVTYCVNEYEITKTISELVDAKEIVDMFYSGEFVNTNLNKGNKELQKQFFKNRSLSMTNFFWLMQDVSNIDDFDVLLPDIKETNKNTLITIFPCFKTKGYLETALNKIGVTGKISLLDDWNVILSPDQLKLLIKEAPYLICMDNDDFSSYADEESIDNPCSFGRKLPPINDDLPTIGLFDTMFEEGCYLQEYVQFERLVSKDYMINPQNKIHGTRIDSILIEGHKLNPDYDDGCGYFKVLHFGVGGKKNIDVPILFNALDEQVKKHCNSVKVWNLSLGDERGINPNYVSLLGAKIDEISRKYNVLFVVAGTNISEEYKDMTIGSPADSFNAIVVNSVISKDKPIPPDYARKGPILTFVQKPDVCYYGGDKEHPLYCYSPNGDYCCSGTSFAAPFIARKAAYLINKMHLSIECAKALLIDSAYGWNVRTGKNNNDFIGYGIVPITIEDVILGKKDEIKMIFSGRTIEQGTLIHDLPILLDSNKSFNYTAKLTFCYFTYGSRNQGVDYSDQEISVKFGCSDKKVDHRDDQEHFIIDSINKDRQAMENAYVGEGKAIQDFGKWNNTKILIEGKIQQNKSKDYSAKNPWWGIYVKHLDRYSSISSEKWEKDPNSVSVRFGIVATFKTTDGTDADLDTYVKRLRSNVNYHVKEIDLEIENDISVQENEEVTFDE